MVYVLLGTGFEEIEALAPVDLMRRAGIEVKTVGLFCKRLFPLFQTCLSSSITSFFKLFLIGLYHSLGLINSLFSFFYRAVDHIELFQRFLCGCN